MHEFKPEQSISGEILCDKCNTKIKWCYRIPPKNYGIYISGYSTDTIFASKLDKNNDDNTYCVRCRNCDRLIQFKYTEE